MEEKKQIKISLSAGLLMISIIIIIAMLCYIYIYKVDCERKMNLLVTDIQNKESIIENLEKQNNAVMNTNTNTNNISNTSVNNTSLNTSTTNISLNTSSIYENNTAANTTNNSLTTNIQPTNTTNKITSIEGDFYPQVENGNDLPYLVFSKDGTVKNIGNFTDIGTYTIENDILKMKYTRRVGPDEDEKINLESQIKIIDENTLAYEDEDYQFIKVIPD